MHRERDPADRRRVVITADAALVWQRLGPAYERIGQRWSQYLATLDEQQIAFATEVLTTAAELNRDETSRLRAGEPN